MLTDMIYQFCKFSESSLPDRKIHPYKRNFLKMWLGRKTTEEQVKLA